MPEKRENTDSSEPKYVDRKEEIRSQIEIIEASMYEPDFWSDKDRAQEKVRELEELKDALEGVGKYDKKNAVVTIFSGAGGDDAEDFSGMLFRMYHKYATNQGWPVSILHANENDQNGYRNVTFEVSGKNAYGILKNESGVHRLVRISPFNANKKRHTSFSMVEVIPKFETVSDSDIVLKDEDLNVEFSRSGGPGGQNANKRETAVRIVHVPTNLSASADAERTQEKNKSRALEILKAKIFRRLEEKRMEEKEGMYVSKTTEAEWGSQIRSYVLHPYKMVKDHRTKVEEGDVDAVLENGKLDEFLEKERNLEEN